MESLKIIIDQASVKLRGEKALAEYLGLTRANLAGVIAGERDLSPYAQEKLEKLMNLDAGSLCNPATQNLETKHTPHHLPPRDTLLKQ